jgi:hypothetical protein
LATDYGDGYETVHAFATTVGVFNFHEAHVTPDEVDEIHATYEFASTDHEDIPHFFAAM